MFKDFFGNSSNFGKSGFDDDFDNFGNFGTFGRFGMGNPHKDIEKQFEEMHKRFANMGMGGMGRGFPKTNFPSAFGDDPFNDDFFKNVHEHMNMNRNMNMNMNNNNINNNFEDEEEPKAKKITYMMDGKKITRTEEPYYEDDGTVKILVREENEDGDVVEYFQ